VNITLAHLIEAAIIRVLDHLEVDNEQLRRQMRTMGVQEAARTCRQVPQAEMDALEHADYMGGLRGVGHVESRELIGECIAQAGLSDELHTISASGWNLLYRVVNAASKRGGLEREKHLVALCIVKEPAPIDMVLHCPKCHTQHIDCPDPVTEGHADGPRESCAGTWTNPPHRSHLCAHCGHIWRPADVPTNGVAAIKTRGKADSSGTMAPVNDEPIGEPFMSPAMLRDAADRA
jgi:hypothetical protein